MKINKNYVLALSLLGIIGASGVLSNAVAQKSTGAANNTNNTSNTLTGPATTAADVSQQGQFDRQFGDQTSPDSAADKNGSEGESPESGASDNTAADTDNLQQ